MIRVVLLRIRAVTASYAGMKLHLAFRVTYHERLLLHSPCLNGDVYQLV